MLLAGHMTLHLCALGVDWCHVPQTKDSLRVTASFYLSWICCNFILNFSLVLVEFPERHCGSDTIYKNYIPKRDLFASLFERDDFRALERHWEITFKISSHLL